MKKIILPFILLVSFIFSSDAFAQRTSTEEDIEVKYIYAELVGIQKLLSTKVSISVDYGNERGFFTDQRIRDEQSGKIQAFNSMVDGLNYMGKDGWEFVQAYVVTIGQQNVYHWLLKKKK